MARPSRKRPQTPPTRAPDETSAGEKTAAPQPPDVREDSGGRPPENAWRLLPRVMMVAIGAVGVALYAWTVGFPMVFDDDMYMRTNVLFKDPRSFTYPFWFREFANLPASMKLDPDLATNFIMRPVAYATLHANYWFDGFNPKWFRAVNILIHALNSILVFMLVRRLMGAPRRGAPARDATVLFVSSVAALFFAAHPLATESVTYIVQRFTSQSTLFFLLTLWLYFRSLDASSSRSLAAWRAASVVSVLAGMLTKECVFTAPIVAVMLDGLVNRTPLRRAAWRALPLLLCLPLIPALVILTATAQNGGVFAFSEATNIVNSIDQPVAHTHYLLTEITVIAEYLRRLFWPTGLNLDPEWPLQTTLVSAPVLKSLAVIVGGLMAAAFICWKRPGDTRARLALASALWFLITIGPSSGIVPLPDLMADHRTYLPSIGIFVLVACALDFLRTSLRPASPVTRWGVPALAAAAVIALCVATTLRNDVWSTPVKLWADTVSKSPNKHRTWGNLGAAWSSAGKDDEAVKCFETALKIEPQFKHAIFNLSNALLRLGRPGESLEASQKLISLENQTTQPEVAFTYAIGLASCGRNDEALNVLKRVVDAMPREPRFLKALGLVLLRSGQPAESLPYLRQAIALSKPDASLENAVQIAENAVRNPPPRPQPAFTPVINPNFRLR